MAFKISFRRIEMFRKIETEKTYDVVIVGGGPAGVAAGIYAARYMLDTVLITKEKGGQMDEAGYVENYPGFKRILGPDLVDKFYDHLSEYKVPVILDEVTNIIREDNGLFTVETVSGKRFRTKTVILALGVIRRKLGVPGEKEFSGRGVSYCAPCDAPLYKEKVVAVVGGGDSAASAALLLADYAKKVYLIHRRDKLRAQPFYVKKLTTHPKIQLILNSNVAEIGGTKTVEWVKIRETGEKIRVDGVFIEIGSDPPKEFFRKIGIETDEKGYAIVGPDQSTNIPGVFAAGDCTTACNRFKQIITAAAQGAVAADSAYRYIIENFGEK